MATCGGCGREIRAGGGSVVAAPPGNDSAIMSGEAKAEASRTAPKALAGDFANVFSSTDPVRLRRMRIDGARATGAEGTGATTLPKAAP
ncbi:MAG: hypothetical protein WC709_12055 [Thermoleophilia bacterium]